MTSFRLLLWTLPALLLAGCCGAPRLNFILEPREVTIVTVPDGADVVQIRPMQQESAVLGTTPLTAITVTVMDDVSFGNLALPNTQELMQHAGTLVVRITKPGYKVYEGTLRTDRTQGTTHRIVLEPEP